MPRTIHSPEQAVLVDLLREWREAAGLRQTDLADQLGRPQSFVSKYEAGERRLDLLEVRLIVQAMGRHLAEFVDLLEGRLERR